MDIMGFVITYWREILGVVIVLGCGFYLPVYLGLTSVNDIRS